MGNKPAFEVDQTIDAFGTFDTVWVCEAPPWNSLYKVLEDSWNEELTVRTITKIQLLDS